jgi:hypothetical protein
MMSIKKNRGSNTLRFQLVLGLSFRTHPDIWATELLGLEARRLLYWFRPDGLN